MGVNDIYLALRRGTPQQAIAYAHKDGIITEIGIRPEKGGQGNRTDLQLIADAVKTGELRSLKDGIDNGAIATFQQLKIAEKVIPIYAPKRNWVPEVIVHWGPSSTGKLAWLTTRPTATTYTSPEASSPNGGQNTVAKETSLSTNSGAA